MALFNKTDPAVKQQRDFENKLKATRASRDDLIERRKLAEAGASAHRAKACKFAAEGADDAALSAAENAMRREQDRAATLSDAISKAEITIADLEREIAQVLDQRCRAETAAAVGVLVEKWSSARADFDTAVSQIVDLARESAVIIVDAHPLKTFAEAVAQQVPLEVDLVTSVLRGHANAVLAGSAPASLPKLPEPVQPTHDMRKTHKGVRGGYQPDPDALGVVDLDGAKEHSTVSHVGLNKEDVIASANFTLIDRGVPERKGTISVHRV